MSASAIPAWFADNIAAIGLLALLALTVVVVRLVHAAFLRTALLGLIVAVALFVYVYRNPLRACARTCECQIADRDLSVPGCSPDDAF